MTETEIMKALECIREAKIMTEEIVIPIGDILDLINRKNAEIEELKRKIENLESVQEISPEAKHFVDTKADKVISLLSEVVKSQEQIKAEAIKEFAERVLEEGLPCESIVLKVAKEMGVEL